MPTHPAVAQDSHASVQDPTGCSRQPGLWGNKPALCTWLAGSSTLPEMARPVGRLWAVPASSQLPAGRIGNLSGGFGQNSLLQVHTAYSSLSPGWGSLRTEAPGGPRLAKWPCWTQKGSKSTSAPHSQCRVASAPRAMDNFMESLNRLKEAHEKEVLGLQNKLLELNSERCRDAQRVEELFAKNHQLREQQKALKENLRVLENRLRAGLCDRCMVTQELARKKQLELESAHLQSLQHLCILTNEMNGLREENKILKEEVKRLRSLGDKAAPQAWEGTSEPPSPMPLHSPSSRKGTTENTPGGPEEAEEEQQPGKDKVSSHKTSPMARVSPAANLPEPRTLDMSPQCISNQLHSTVAVVRPGSRACPPDCSTANGTPPPPSTRSSPPSPAYEHSLRMDSFLRASRPSAIAYETLKRSLQADRLSLLNRHLSLHLQSPHSSTLAPATSASSPLPHGLKAREAETWDEPGAFMGMQDPRLEGALHLLLIQQQLRARARAGSARSRVPSAPEEMPSPSPAGSDSENSESEDPRTALSTDAQPNAWHPQSTGQGCTWRKEAHLTTQDCPPDKPLDLSDRGRCRDISKLTGQALPLSPTVVHTASPQPPTLSRPLIHSPHNPSNDSTETKAQEPEEHAPPEDTSHPLPGTHASLASPGRTDKEAGGMPMPVPHLQRVDPDRTTEPSKVMAQRPELERLEEELDTSDTKVSLTSKASAEPSIPGEGHAEDQQQGPQQKRKWASDLQDKAPKKPSNGRRKPQEPLTPAEDPRSPRDMEDCSLSPISSCQES